MKILSIKETKNRLIDFLFSRSEYMRRVNEVEFQTRCPYCGDSYKDLNTGHFYIRIDPEDNFMIPCICFKCDYRGIINRETLSLMDCDDEELLNGIVRLNIVRNLWMNRFICILNESSHQNIDMEGNWNISRVGLELILVWKI